MNNLTNKMNKKLKNRQKHNSNDNINNSINQAFKEEKSAISPLPSQSEPQTKSSNPNTFEIPQALKTSLADKINTSTNGSVAIENEPKSSIELPPNTSGKKVNSVVVSVKSFTEKSEVDEVTVCVKKIAYKSKFNIN